MHCPCAASKIFCSKSGNLSIDYLKVTDNILKLCKECKWLLMVITVYHAQTFRCIMLLHCCIVSFGAAHYASLYPCLSV